MKYLITAILAIASAQVYSQSIHETLRYSILDYGSTARNMGVSGSMASMGADISAGGINPAGFAEYRKSEFSITMGASFSSIDAAISNGQLTNSSKSRANLRNIALVFSHRPIASPWKTSNFVIGYNKIASFNRRFEYSGTTQGTMVERFVGLADGFIPDELDDFAAGPAYTVGAIYDFDEDNFYETDFGNFLVDVPKSQVVETKGGISELVIGMAGTFENKISIGISLGVPFYSYEETKSYSEADDNDAIDFFNELAFDEYLRTSGVGINAKFGIIAKPTKKLRLAASIHSPSLYFLTDDFYNDITYSFTDNEGVQTFTEPSPDGNFKYRISSPWRAIVGAGYIFGFEDLKGFLSAEMEYVDYTASSFNLTSNSNSQGDRDLQDDLNRQIDENFTSVTNFRLGAEIAYNALRFRAGYSMSASPYVNGNFFENTGISGGIGYRANQYFLDLAVKQHSYQEEYFPYYLSDESRIQLVEKDNSILNVVFTFGYKI